MGLQGWILLITGVIVGIPALWIIQASIKGPPRFEPTSWCELPAGAGDGFHAVFALKAPFQERLPDRVEDFAGLTITQDKKRVGLVLSPGQYWVYAVPMSGNNGVIGALDAAWSALRTNPDIVLTLPDLPITVRE